MLKLSKCAFSLTVIVVALSGCVSDRHSYPSQNQTADADTVAYFTDTGLSNPISILQHPAGEHANGVTYITYQGVLEDPYAAFYNHNTKKWSGPIKAGTSEMGKNPSRKIENHGKPALIIDDLGYTHIAFGGHGGTPELGVNKLGNYNYGKMKHVVSKRPYDITEWEERDNISPFGTYNQWLKMSNGDLYLFYRHGVHQSNWVYQKSTDNGASFGEPVSVMLTKEREDGLGVDSWYGYFSEAGDNTIAFAFNYHRCGNSHSSGSHLGERTNGYYMQLNTSTGEWTNVQGETLTMPMTREVANDKTLVLNTDGSDHWTSYSSVHLDEYGYPHIRYSRGPHMGRKHGGPKKPNYYRWNGTDWLIGKDNELPIGKGDMFVKSAMKIDALLASRTKDRESLISWWSSDNGGNSFKQGDVVLLSKENGFEVSSFIRNAHPDALMLVAEKAKGTHLRKMYLVGEKGPVIRERGEAHHAIDAMLDRYRVE